MIKKDESLIGVGIKIRDERIHLGLSQEQLATKARLHRTYIGMVERAEKNITLTNIEKISKVLGISLKSLLVEQLIFREVQSLLKYVASKASIRRLY